MGAARVISTFIVIDFDFLALIIYEVKGVVGVGVEREL